MCSFIGGLLVEFQPFISGREKATLFDRLSLYGYQLMETGGQRDGGTEV
jgi:hypothetical protein